MSAKITLVTGASGYIGRHLGTAMTKEGITYVGVSTRESDPNELRQRLTAFALKGVDSIVNLGWPASSTSGYKNSQENSLAALKAIELGGMCADLGIHLFGIGTPAEFFPHTSEYARSKLACREGLEDLIHNGKASWLRPHYVFDNRNWPEIVRSGAAGDLVRIENNFPHFFIHVEDVATAIATAVARNITGEVDILHIRKAAPSEILAALGFDYEILPAQEPPHRDRGWDCTKLLNAGWFPTVTEALLPSGSIHSPTKES
jgi:nucleoside-diphosphate-sugar epimerase